jgi:hypothetical protein
MPTYSRATRGPLRDASTNAIEGRAKLEHRLEREDDDARGVGLRVRPKNKSGPKKFGLEVCTGRFRFCHWYRTERARDQGLASMRNKYSKQIWRKTPWTVQPIEN